LIGNYPNTIPIIMPEVTELELPELVVEGVVYNF
jgi:hypothetical protein